jgi:predicted deacylase
MFMTDYHWGVRSIFSGLLGFLFSFNIVAQTTGVSSLPSSVIGKSVKQQAITERTFGTGQHHILIIGGIHGDEPATSDLARALALAYEQTPPPADLMVSIINEANPDGLATRTRVNGRGVDLNRNFPARSWQAIHFKKKNS